MGLRPGGEFKFNDGGLSQIVSYTHQMQKGEPVVVWPMAGRPEMIWLFVLEIDCIANTGVAD